MTVAAAYVLHGIQTPTTFYSQVEEAGPTPGAQALLQTPAGWPVPMFRGIRGLKPEVPFRTTQLATLLGQVGIYGSDLSAGNTDLHYRAMTNLGSRVADATTSHKRLRMAKAFVHWRSIQARHQQEASADCRLVALWDGSNAPIVAAGSLALAGTAAASQFYGLGPVSINGVALGDELEMSIDLGQNLFQAGGGSECYDSFLAVKDVNPVITLKHLNIASWETYGLTGTALTSFTAYLRAMAADGAGCYQANGSSVHIKFTATKGMIAIDNNAGGGNTEVSNSLKIYLRTDAVANAPLTIAVNQAIT